jgi:hypothetical protein
VRVYSIADADSDASVELAARITEQIPGPYCSKPLSGTAAGSAFERATLGFVEAAMAQLASHAAPGLRVEPGRLISDFDQYRHLAELKAIVQGDLRLESAIGGDYLVRPDIVVSRPPLLPTDIGPNFLGEDISGRRSSMLASPTGSPSPLLHASISCKWTIRSDRSQNTRTEALNLVRNRKGRAPHIVAVTMEPLPSRLASIAVGTGDIDVVYHAALDELVLACDDAAEKLGGSYVRARERLEVLVEGRRMRDIADLPIDLLL